MDKNEAIVKLASRTIVAITVLSIAAAIAQGVSKKK